MKRLRTARLALIPVTSRNAAELWELLNEPDLRQYQDIPRMQSSEFARQVRARPKRLTGQATGRFEWILQRLDTLALIGWISLRINDRVSGVGEIGYSLLAAERGYGFATEGVEAVLAEGFLTGELAEIQACCVPANEASRSVLGRLGFLEERLITNGATIRGRRVDILLFRLHRAAWRRAHALPEHQRRSRFQHPQS